MKILVERIPEEGSHFDGRAPAALLALEDEAFIQVEDDVAYTFYVQQVSEELIVRGMLSVPLALQCTRCAEFFSTTVTDSDFLRAYPVSRETDSVDITPDMREDLLLHIPPFPICGEECKGLCAQCGADLNKNSCDCESGDQPSPWSALDGLEL